MADTTPPATPSPILRAEALRPLPAAEAMPWPDFVRGGTVKPLFTVGIPAYRSPELLTEALANLAAQTGGDDFEVVICDDGGLAATRAVIEKSDLRNVRYYVNRPRLGAVANWNRCLQLAAGPWVTILHEDDLLYPWFFATVRPHLREGISAVAVRCTQADAPPPLEAPAQPSTGATIRTYAAAWFLKSSMTPFPGVVFPRELGLRLGGFDAREGGVADYAFWYALARAGRILTIDQTAAFYRITQGQWTEQAWPSMLRRSHLLRLRIARDQLPGSPRLGRWLARFYTGRMARAYSRRFSERPGALLRANRFRRIPFGWISSGWVWRFLQFKFSE